MTDNKSTDRILTTPVSNVAYNIHIDYRYVGKEYWWMVDYLYHITYNTRLGKTYRF